jgi:uncharacterized membrane protein
MNHECVVAVYGEWDEARQAVQRLEEAGIPQKQVSLVTHSVTEEVPDRQAMQHGDESEHGAAAGAGVGGLLGFLLGAPLLTIPGVGPLLIAGPLATGATGAIVGGFLGALGNWGVHEDHVASYEELVQQGKMLAVDNDQPDQLAEAKRLLDTTPAEEVRMHMETSADHVEP